MEKPTNSAQHQPSDRIKLNVGGRLFETTVSTARFAGTDSLLAALSIADRHNESIFIDRDPDIFSVLLSTLRSGTLPSSTSSRFSRQELLHEAAFYGVESPLRSALAAPPLSGIDASLVSTVVPASDGFVSAFTAFDDHHGSVWMAHGGQISTYDSLLVHSSTIRTHLDEISSICRVSPNIAAIGSENASGVHFYDTSVGSLTGSTYWTDSSDPRIYKSTITAVADTPGPVIFASFECRHGENAVIVIDKSTLEIVSEFGRQSGNSSKYAAAGKLRWTPSRNVLVGTSVSSGAFGCAGYIRLWDPRSGDMVWEACEPGSGRSSRYGDALADADVDVEESMVFKVCSKSGDLGMADMRCLGEDPWVYLEDPSPVLRSKEGAYGNSVVHCYRSQVFVGRDEGLQVWSRVEGGDSNGGAGEYRRNFVDKVEDKERGVIRRIDGGGNRLFICRDNVEGIEVWESSHLSDLVSFM